MNIAYQNSLINLWKEKVESYLNELSKEISNNEISNGLNYGFYAFDGKLIFQPEVMFIGINPGKGNGIKKEIIKILPEEDDRLSYLDYFDGEYNYPLAQETVSLFKEVGLTENEIIEKFENRFVKTNFFYIATNNEPEIKQCLNAIGKYKEFFRKSAEFTLELIKILKPKVIIFEGKSAYENIVVQCIEAENTWKDGIGYFKSDQENIAYIGYSRIFSNMRSDKIKLAELIRNELRFKLN